MEPLHGRACGHGYLQCLSAAQYLNESCTFSVRLIGQVGDLGAHHGFGRFIPRRAGSVSSRRKSATTGRIHSR